MMMTPSIFGEDLFNSFFGFDEPVFRYPQQARHNDYNEMMRTDVKENEEDYELDISLPGFKKEDISVELKDGTLIIQAKHTEENDKKDEKSGKYIRKERYYGSCSRSFYVGEGVRQEDIHAQYENGVLKLVVPKVDPKAPEMEQKHYIAIEG